MSDAAREITNLIYTTERLDAGDPTRSPNCSPTAGSAVSGRTSGDGVRRCRPVRQMYDMATWLYEDGTPKRITTRPTCSCMSTTTPGPREGKSYYCVTQATPELPLRVIVTATTTTPSTGSTAAGGSTPGRCSSIRSATSAAPEVRMTLSDSGFGRSRHAPFDDDRPVASSPRPGEQELAALRLIEHPTVRAAYRDVAETWLARAKPSAAMRGAFDDAFRRVMFSAAVWSSTPGQAASESQLHHPPQASRRRAALFPDPVGASTIPTASTA